MARRWKTISRWLLTLVVAFLFTTVGVIKFRAAGITATLDVTGKDQHSRSHAARSVGSARPPGLD
jgi:hypothetical protein